MILDKHVIDRTLDVRVEPTERSERVPVREERRPERLRFESTRFGTLEVDTDLILTLPEGMIGFEHCTRYVVISTEDNGTFRWLQSLDQAGTAFPILAPTSFRPDYAPTISDTDARFLELSAESPFLLFCIVTVPLNAPREMTANLLGPLIINSLTRRGKQVIVQDEGFMTRHRIVDELSRATTITTPPRMLASSGPTRQGRASRAA
jgi:flagellar assembly factor FliW